MKNITLNNGIEIPILGFGTYQIPDEQAETAVLEAINAGYRHIDTAQSYQNESGVGRGMKKSGIQREKVFLTTKIWVENTSYEGVRDSLQRSLSRLNTDYIDMVLLHQPYNDVYGAWKALEEAQKSGTIHAIGVSNFSVDRAIDLAEFNEVTPQVNQIEVNPFHQQEAAKNVLKDEGIAIEAWAPFAEGKNHIFQNETLKTIGSRYNKSVAQIIIRWLVERNIIVLSKSVNPERMKENLDVFDFSLSPDDMSMIETLNIGESQFFSHADPSIIKWMASRKMNV